MAQGETEANPDSTTHPPGTITKEQLKIIFPDAINDHLLKIAEELNKDLVKFKLDTRVRRAHFFGQIRQEVGPAVKQLVENFNYAPEGLIITFGYYKNRRNEALSDGRKEEFIPGTSSKKTIPAKQEDIANKVYGKFGAGNKLGNLQPSDGWKYRGRGLKQTTGRYNYTVFNKEHKFYWGEHIDFVESPDLVAQYPYAVRSAVVFWLTNKCWGKADKGMNDTAIDEVSRIVNSGEVIKHEAGIYAADKDPVLKRRAYAFLAHSVFA